MRAKKVRKRSENRYFIVKEMSEVGRMGDQAKCNKGDQVHNYLMVM